MNIRQLNNSEFDDVITLSLSVFTECGTADFDIKGLETFKSFIHNKELMDELTIFGAFDNDRLIGIIGTKNAVPIISPQITLTMALLFIFFLIEVLPFD